MRVDNNLSNPWLESVASSKAEGQKTDGATASSRVSVHSGGGVADLPDDSFSMKSAGPDAPRTDKIEALQRAIASGSYNVSAESIADAILREWQA